MEIRGADEKRENARNSAMVSSILFAFRLRGLVLRSLTMALMLSVRMGYMVRPACMCSLQQLLFTLIPFSPSKEVFVVSFFHLAGLHAYSVASHQRLHGREQAVIQAWEQYFLSCQQLFCSMALL